MTGPGTQSPVLDRTAFEGHRATYGDARVLHFLGLLEGELARRANAVDEAARRDARAEIAMHAHAIASAAGNLGFSALLTLGRRLEAEIGTLPEDRVGQVLDELRREIREATDAVQALRADIGPAAG